MEINLVQQVELKLLLADTDEKLSKSLSTFLVPLIQKLASSNVEVVHKVVEVLRFIKKKKENSPNGIVFPFDKLYSMYEACVFDASPPIARQNTQLLSFMAIELKTGNIQPTAEQFVRGLRNYGDFNKGIRDNAAKQFAIFLFLLEQRPELDATDWEAADVAVLQSRLSQLFLLDLRHRSMINQLCVSTADAESFVDASLLGITPENDSGMNKARLAALKFARNNPSIMKNVLVAAMGDPMLDVSRQARSEVAKLDDFDLDVLQQWAIGASEALRIEIVELMIRKHLTQSVDPQVILSAFQTTNLRLRQSVLQLLQEVLKTSFEFEASTRLQIALVLRQYISDDGWPRSQTHSSAQTRVRQQCYELLGEFDRTPSTLNFLFQSLERDSPEMAASIQKSLTKILDSSESTQVDEQKLLGYMQRSQNSRTKYAVVQFAIQKLSPTNPLQRAILLLGVDLSVNPSDVVLEAQRGIIQSSALPSFDDMLDAVIHIIRIREQTNEQLVNYSLLFLLSCFVQIAPLSMDWTDELVATLQAPSSPLVDKMKQLDPAALASLLFSFFDGKFFSVVPLILKHCIVPQLSTDTNRLVNTLADEDNGYGAFVAEYLPVISPETQISGHNRLQILARAFQSAVQQSHSEEVVQLAIEAKNVDAIVVLAASNLLPTSDELQKLVKRNHLALACLVVNSDEQTRNETLKSLLQFNSRAFDEIVANGEAISVVASGWQSRVLQEKYPELARREHSQALRLWGVEEAALNAVSAGIRGSPESRRMACVRLLCLLQYSFYNISEHPGVASGIQRCFMTLLSDSDEVTQQSAGRGLEILFEFSHNDKNLQDGLLESLISSFTDNASAKRTNAGTLTADTQIFEPGALPTEPNGGGSISTYKDVLDLANETGDSSLVYKFMSLSANSQIWAGRKGMAFSLQQILSRSELAQQIFDGSELGKRLIPKLYLYLYDPYEATKTAMKNIWLALIPSTRRSSVIKLYLPQIKTQVFAGVIEREWRIRQASTLALSDLVSQNLVPDTIEVWRAGFRAVDDIKDSVSKAGSELLHSLTSSLVRASSSGKKMDLSEILPFLLKGLSNESTVKFSLNTILKLSETSGFKPYAVQVVEELTLQLSSIEPQALNYLALNSSQSLVDEARAQGMRNSPIMQGIEAMVERGNPSPQEMWAILPRIVKKSVGVSSKLASARLITLTSMVSFGNAKEASEQLMSAAINELFGKNDLVSQNYASSIAYLCRKAKMPLVLKYIDVLRQKFASSESDDLRLRKIVAQALTALSNSASDVYSSVSSSVLPLVFVGSCLDKEEAAPYTKVWENNAGGSASLKLYVVELFDFCCTLLTDSTARVLRIAAGHAVERALASDQRITVDLSKLATTLLANLSGRSWPGKEHIFAGLVALYPYLSDDLKPSVEERVLQEIQRKNLDYKLAILPNTVQFLESARSGDTSGHIMTSTIDAAIAANTDSDEMVDAVVPVLKLGDHSVFEHLLSLNSWKYRYACCAALQKLPFDAELWATVTKFCANDEAYERVRLEWARAASCFPQQGSVRKDAEERLQIEKSSVVAHELKSIL